MPQYIHNIYKKANSASLEPQKYTGVMVEKYSKYWTISKSCDRESLENEISS